MTIRTSSRTIRFRNPFLIEGFEEELPAGTYVVETDEELIEGISFAAYRQISMFLRLNDTPGRPGVKQVLTINREDLEAALRRDAAI
jgi:hypothetical protein